MAPFFRAPPFCGTKRDRGQHSRPGGHILHRRTEGGQHAELVTPGSPTHPHGQGKYAAAAEPRCPQRALATTRHRDVTLLVITCGRARHQHRRAGRTLTPRATRLHSPSPHFPQMRISFMGPDVFPKQMLHLGSSPGMPAAGQGWQSRRRARHSHLSAVPGKTLLARRWERRMGSTHHAGCPSRGPSTWSCPQT